MKTVWIDNHPPELPGFGLAQVKAEGTTVFYDFDGFDIDAEWVKVERLQRRWFQTKRVKRKVNELKGNILAYKQEQWRRQSEGT